MKIVITGHTNGIGKGIYDYFNSNNQVIGFSLSNGYDISNEYDRQFIIHECKDADIFVNNAYKNHDASQNLILTNILNMKTSIKNIINISSNTKSKNEYGNRKRELNKICYEYSGPIHIINIRPGYVDTKRVKSINHKKMSVDDVVDIIIFCITHKLKITEIEFSKR